MIDQLLLVKKRKIKMQTGEEGPQQHVGYFTKEGFSRQFIHPYYIDNGVQWHIYSRVVDAFVYNKVYACIVPDRFCVIITGPEHTAFLQALLAKIGPQCASLENLLKQYQGVAGSMYEPEVKQVILESLGHMDSLERGYLRQFLPSVVSHILDGLAASEAADKQGQAADTRLSEGSRV
jgi:hypothetical protein